jgi:LuxR family transcriptional regulator, maltose regulon positive regulatory protein
MVAPPVVPAYAVDRGGLRHQLDKALTCPLTLIVAPAGAGKTVLLTQWTNYHPELAFVWVEIGAEDNDPVRFSQRLLRGLAAVNPDFADLASLVSLHGGGLGAPLLEALEGQLAELPEVVIVLDDLHHLSNPILISDLGGLAHLVPPNIHLVLSTRTDLPIAWSRHRLNQQLIEIRQADLALDDADSALLLEHITGRSLGADRVATLVARTEGWAAGLQLAGMTLRLYDDSDEFITQFSGDDRLIADYLSEEVLQSLPGDRRQLLLTVSVLGKMCAELVTHLTGESNAQLVLDQLERESMFLVSLDTHRRWFRFHHLFRDMLRFTLRAEHPARESELLTKAASWHLERGDVDAGVEYLLSAHNWAEALEVIMTRGSEVFERGEMATVIRWISEVPESVRKGRRDVSLLLGMLKGLEGQAASAEDILGRLATDIEASDGERVCAQVSLAAQVQWRPRAHVSIDMAVHALDLLNRLGDAQIPFIMNLTHRQSLETMAVLSCGRAHFQAGQFDQARDWLDRGLATRGATYPIWKVSGLGSLGLLEAWCGNTKTASAISDEALAVAREVGLLVHPCTADAYLASTLTAIERGEPGRASLSLHEGILRAEANRRSQLSWIGHLESALLQEADGQRDQAMTTALSTRNDLGAPPPPVVADRLLALQSRLLRLGGAPDHALRAFDTTVPHAAASAFEHAATALTLGDRDLAHKLIHPMRGSFSSTQPLTTVEGLLLMAWLADVDGFVDEARMHLAEAMVVAERQALVEVFVRAGSSMLRLISVYPDQKSAFRQRVLERAREVTSPSPGEDLIDPLTDRELEILSYLPSRYTNTELAEHFYVSVNTIKTHMAHIYRKLDVANRNGAIIRAREIGLL